MKELEKIIRESDLTTFFKCPHRYYLQRFLGLSHTPITLPAAMVTFFEQQRHTLLTDRNQIFAYQTRAGKELKPFEEMTAKELLDCLKFRSPQTFGSHVQGFWMQMIKKRELQGRRVVLNYDKEPFISGRDLQTAATNYYQFILDNGAPYPEMMGKQHTFRFNGNLFISKIPEFRRGLVIVDPTIWGFNKDFKEDNHKSSLETSALVTLRILAYMNLLSNYTVRSKLKINEQTYASLSKIIDPRIIYKHFNATKNEITDTFRDENSLDTLNRSIDLFLEETSKEHFQPNHSSCNSCPYNCIGANGRFICNERKPRSKPSAPEFYFKKRSYTSEIKDEENTITITGKVSNGEIEHEVGKIILQIQDSKVSATYISEIRGLDFESRLLREMNQLLEAKALPLTCHLSEPNFLGSGIETTKRTLKELGYNNFKKNYASIESK